MRQEQHCLVLLSPFPEQPVEPTPILMGSTVSRPGLQILSSSHLSGCFHRRVLVGSQTVINVVLVSDVAEIDEVVVVGYGVQKKESVVAAISQVSGDRLRNVKDGGKRGEYPSG
jgi:hypothetical protein